YFSLFPSKGRRRREGFAAIFMSLSATPYLGALPLQKRATRMIAKHVRNSCHFVEMHFHTERRGHFRAQKYNNTPIVALASPARESIGFASNRQNIIQTVITRKLSGGNGYAETR